MRILVTGGAGFIGSNLIRYLLEEASAEGAGGIGRVVNLDKLTYAASREPFPAVGSDPRYVFEHGDICDGALVEEILRKYRIDRVVHLAAESHVDRSIDDPGTFVRTNVLGTFTLLEAFRRHLRGGGAGEKAVFIHVSTHQVFGSLEPDAPAFNEASPYSPNSPYSASKAGGDHLARAYFRTYGVPVVTVNCSNNYGPRQFPEKLIPLMIRKLVKGEKLPVYGDGGQIRDWLFVDDQCRGLLAALLKGCPGETYALGGRCERTNLEVVRELISAVRELAPGIRPAPGEASIAFVEDRPGHDRRYAIDGAKAEAGLGWVPLVDFGDGLRRTVRWYLENEGWVRTIEEGSYRGERLGTLP